MPTSELLQFQAKTVKYVLDERTVDGVMQMKVIMADGTRRWQDRRMLMQRTATARKVSAFERQRRQDRAQRRQQASEHPDNNDDANGGGVDGDVERDGATADN